MDAGQPPAAGPADGDVGRAERAVDGASPVVTGLGVRADGDRRVAVDAGRLDGPLQGGGVQVPGAVALRPLLPVQDEAERADQLEVGNRQGVEGDGVARLLGGGPGVVQFADVAGGREGAAVRYDGFGRILFPVFHNERATYSDASGLLEQLGQPYWRLWSYDRAANTAVEIPSVDWNSGAIYVLPVGGKTHLLIPGADYAATKVVRLEGATATPLFETRGWAIRLFQIR